jgi:protein-tyrosine phosphatase
VIDLHAHVLPGFDDGVRSLEEAREVARTAAAEGVEAIVATPHVRDDYPTRADAMERGVAALGRDLAEQGIPVRIERGGEVAIERVWQLDDSELARFALGGAGRYLLVEFPYRGWPQLLGRTVAGLERRGIGTVLAHPERNAEVQAEPARLDELVAAGALVQLTASSVDGRLGPAPQRTSFALLERGAAHVIASDVHGPRLREGGLSAARAALDDEALADRLTRDAPRAILAGVDPPR